MCAIKNTHKYSMSYTGITNISLPVFDEPVFLAVEYSVPSDEDRVSGPLTGALRDVQHTTRIELGESKKRRGSFHKTDRNFGHIVVSNIIKLVTDHYFSQGLAPSN